MSTMTTIPGADRSKYFGTSLGGAVMHNSRLEKMLLHSTETSAKWGCPGYQGGLAAPTFTISPWSGYRKVWQHFPLNWSAKALVDSSSTAVRENRDGVIQVEIVGYSDLGHARTYGFNLREMPDEDMAFLADTLAPIMLAWDIPLAFPARWPMYPDSYGSKAGARMSGPTYDAYRGVLGHLHVPGNTHGDPAINVAKLRDQLARRMKGDTPAPGRPGGDHATPTRPKEWDEMATKKEIQDAVTAAIKEQIPAIAEQAGKLAAQEVWAQRSKEYYDENGNKVADQRSRGHVADRIHERVMTINAKLDRLLAAKK